MKKYGVGVFGIGWVAGEHIKAYMQNPHMEVGPPASRRKESARAKKEELCLAIDRSIETGQVVRLPLDE
jgi:predicted dehydrogenase